MIEFYLNGQPQTVSQLDPNMSILDWLRTKMRLTGTKEGCASGDCGACTVVIGRVNAEGALSYEPINSCISLVGSLQGAHLITVDALQNQPVHPVQKTMMDCHGAQCGFCTPGFIMSLFALHQAQQGQAADDETLLEALSGNLCRCTGYRPIVDAGREAMVQTWSPDEHAPALDHPDITAHLSRIQNQTGTLEASDPDSDAWYKAPSSLAELRNLVEQYPDARLVAGSTDLALEITQQLKTLPHLISLQQVSELHAISDQDDRLSIGSAVNYETLRPALDRYWPAFEPMLKRLGSLQIRHRGTLGGNIGNASPIADMPPPLIALGAELVLDGPQGERRLPLEAFFLDYRKTDLRPGEFIRAVDIPKPGPDDHLFIYKVSKRLDDDISAVLGAFHITLTDGRVQACRLAWGGMAATPARAPAAEAALLGQPWTQATLDNAAQALAGDFKPLSDVRASADYRQQVAGNLLRRAWLASQTNDQALPVTDYA